MPKISIWVVLSLLVMGQVIAGNKCVNQLDIEQHCRFDDDLQVRRNSAYSDQIPFDSAPLPLEIVPLIVSGPYENRVDLVFFSDGYIPAEREKFLSDARYLAEDVSGNQTFNTVKPLLNFWAAFTPSEESGVGRGGNPKKTPFGLYRDGTELRGVYTAYPKVIEDTCGQLGDQCDYPILLGNDPLYGGLGGYPTIITSSILNGPQILRHELGHSIIPVGEEYDGGYAYCGVDAYHDLSNPVPWAHHLSRPDEYKNGERRVERAVMPLQKYAWSMLNTIAPWTTTFESSGMYSRHLVRMSLSGLPEKDDLRVEVDGRDVGWEPKTGLGVDRWHYDFHFDEPLAPGEHKITFTLLKKEREGIAQMCSVEVLEFGDENEFVSSPGYYGLFPTFSDKNETTYRPTNEDCLMRQVTTPNFCKVCIEGLWLSLLRRVSLIDDVSIHCGAVHQTVTLEVSLVPLAQFREGGLLEGESYTITWSQGGEVLEELKNQTKIAVPPGKYNVDVQLSTPEVILDMEGYTKGQREVDATNCVN